MTVTDITQQKKNTTRYNIFVDGEFYCGLNDQTVVGFSIKKGSEITAQELREAIDYDMYCLALARALEYAARTSGKSRADFIDKLEEYPEPTVHKVLCRLEELGYINDRELAKQMVERSLQKGEGPLMIRQRLMQKRISRMVADDVCEVDHDLLLEAAIKSRDSAIERYGCADVKQRSKVYAAMQRKGFTYDIISEVLSMDEE